MLWFDPSESKGEGSMSTTTSPDRNPTRGTRNSQVVVVLPSLFVWLVGVLLGVWCPAMGPSRMLRLAADGRQATQDLSNT